MYHKIIAALHQALPTVHVSRHYLLIPALMSGVAVAGAQETGTAVDAPSMTLLVMKLMLALVIIVVLIYLTAFIARRRWRGQTPRSGMRILAHHYVGPRKMIQLLQIGKRGLLIGVTERSITALGELDEDELQQFNAEQEQSLPGERSSFGDALKAAFTRRNQNA